MSYFIQSFSIWKTRRASSRNDDAEFGLDLPSQGSAISGTESSHARKKQPCAYGAISDNVRCEKVEGLADTGGKLYAGLHQVSAVAAGLFLLFVFARRLLQYVEITASLASGASPSPSPGFDVGSQAPTCAAYQYPQCEAALQWQLSRSARNRCEAFERVKGEGDYFKFPYSESSQDMCDPSQPGCCGCTGQCSKCPPLLAECFSWRFDGSWKIAFEDGSESKYVFDAHGHCEVKIASSSLPVTWKYYDQMYISRGADISDPHWLTVNDAKRFCREEPHCKGFTYDESTLTAAGTYLVFLKSRQSLSPGSGTGWKSYVQEDRPSLHGTASVAGPLTQVSSDAPGSFRFDLHEAAPQLFPAGSIEHLTVSGDELRVERRYPGTRAQAGHGYRKHL